MQLISRIPTCKNRSVCSEATEFSSAARGGIHLGAMTSFLWNEPSLCPLAGSSPTAAFRGCACFCFTGRAGRIGDGRHRGRGQFFIPGVRLAGTRAVPDRRAGASLQGLAHFKHPAAAERHRPPVYCTCLPYTASVARSRWCLALLGRWNTTLHLLLASPEKQTSPGYSQNLLLITSQLTEEGFAQV